MYCITVHIQSNGRSLARSLTDVKSTNLPPLKIMIATSTEVLKPSHRRVIADELGPLNELARSSSSLIAAKGGRFVVGQENYELPRYLFIGPKGGGDTIRLGLFAGIHGDEPEGVHALIRFLQHLETEPQLARGYCLFIYPICNPTGFEDRTRQSRAGKDLNREFWRNSSEPEVRLLQSGACLPCYCQSPHRSH